MRSYLLASTFGAVALIGSPSTGQTLNGGAVPSQVQTGSGGYAFAPPATTNSAQIESNFKALNSFTYEQIEVLTAHARNVSDNLNVSLSLQALVTTADSLLPVLAVARQTLQTELAATSALLAANAAITEFQGTAVDVFRKSLITQELVDIPTAQRKIADLSKSLSSYDTMIGDITNISLAAGAMLSVVDLGADVYAITQMERGLDRLVKEAVLVVDTGLAFGSMFYPVIGATQTVVKLTDLYVDLYGDAVREGTDSRVAAIFQELENANLIIQNRIVALYQGGIVPTDEMVQAIANEQYEQSRRFVESMRQTGAGADWLWGLRATNNDAVDAALDIIGSLQDGRAARRAVQYNEYLRQIFTIRSQLDGLANVVSTTVDSLPPAMPAASDPPVVAQPAPQPTSPVNPPAENSPSAAAQIEEMRRQAEAERLRLAEIERQQLAELERQRLEEERRQREAGIAGLVVTRDSLVLLRADVEFRLNESRNRLTALEFEDRERAGFYLRAVDQEIAVLRPQLQADTISVADRRRLTALLSYQVTLEAEILRINAEEQRERVQLATLTAQLAANTADVAANTQALTRLGYNVASYTGPVVQPGTPVDWSAYRYQPPPFPTVTDTPVWGGMMSLTGQSVTPGTAAMVVTTSLRTNGEAPVNNALFFSPGIGSTNGQLAGRQSTASVGHSFSHLIWGEWAGGSRVYTDERGGTARQLVGRFVYGEFTPVSARMSGTANYTGRILADSHVGNEVIQRGLSGEFGLRANFSANTLSGWLAGRDANNLQTYVADINGGRLDRGAGELRFSGNLASTYDDHYGQIDGYFFGAAGTEVGGAFNLRSRTGNSGVSGILLGWETPSLPARPVDTMTIGGSLVTFYAPGASFADQIVMTSLPTAAQPRKTIQIPNHGTASTSSVLSQGNYSHTAWGKWAADAGSPADYRNGGYWVAGHQTSEDGMQRQVGTATYNGAITGDLYVNNVSRPMTGDIKLTADFDRGRIDGSMRMSSGTRTTGDLPISSNIAGAHFGMGTDRVIGGETTSYGMQGQFFGADAQEMGGSAYAFSPSGNYHGVFRAAR